MLKGKITFGFNAVAAGQKTAGVSNEPLFVITSTPGGFRITPAVSAALQLAAGDYIQLNDNIAQIDEAIRMKNPDLVALCEENGLNLENAEDVQIVRNELREFSISKGVAILNADGSVKQVAARSTKEEKQAFFEQHTAEIIEENRDALTELAKQNGIENPTDEDLAAVVPVEKLVPRMEDAYTGSKLANLSGMTGFGLTLNFTDSNMWNVMKSDLNPETRESVRRTYTVDLKTPTTAKVSNGKELIEVPAYKLVDVKDEAVTPRGKKNEAAAED
jgi:hypothetical protein